MHSCFALRNAREVSWLFAPLAVALAQAVLPNSLGPGAVVIIKSPGKGKERNESFYWHPQAESLIRISGVETR